MEKMKKQKYEYWTDRVAKEIKQRVSTNPILKKVVKKNGYIVNDAKTPSGKIHIGSARGWIIHDIITKSMRENGMKAKFILGNDNMDPFDSMPANLDKTKFEKFLGVPLINVPSPEPGYDNFADYYFNQATEKFDKFNIEAEIYKTSKIYFDGKFNDAIRTVLDSANKIQEIYKKIYGKSIGAERLPFTPICEKCGKIGTTAAYKWDSERKVVIYRCEPKLVEWAVGCGHEGEISPFDGNGKMPYKVEWAAKWFVLGVVAETAGKDHFSANGSRAISNAISLAVFDYPPPWPSSREEVGQGYEFFLVEGKKMSTSKGIGTSFVEISGLVPPKILRFLMVKTRPETTIDFKEENMPMVYEDFERHEKIYFGLEKVDKREKTNAKRVYELSVIDGIPKIKSKSELKKSYVPFETLKNLIKIMPENNGEKFLMKNLKELGFSTNETALKKIHEKIEFVKYWIENFGEKKIEVMKYDINPKVKTAIRDLIEVIKTAENEKDLQNKIFQIAKQNNVQPRELFRNVYIILLNSERGPRLAPYIFEVGKEQIIKKLQSAL